MNDNLKYEKELRKAGYKLIAGIDEVGRGPLVGPVVAACVILPEKFDLDGLTDSKKLSEKKRNYFYDKIMECALGVGIGVVSNEVIDDINIYEATKLAMKDAINNCSVKPDYLLIDAMKLDVDIPSTSIIKGDLLSITISAASVIAKVYRDNLMYELDKLYPEYDFKSNKGYGTKKHIEALNRYGYFNGTKKHIEALKRYGYLKEHRKSFKPVCFCFERKD